jgi:hypothetical protein
VRKLIVPKSSTSSGELVEVPSIAQSDQDSNAMPLDADVITARSSEFLQFPERSADNNWKEAGLNVGGNISTLIVVAVDRSAG